MGAALPSAHGADTPPNDTIATIDGDPILIGEYEAFAANYLKRKLYHSGSDARVTELRQEALQELIRERLLIREANKRGLEGDVAAVKARLSALEQKYAGSPDQALFEAERPKLERLLLDLSKVDALEAEVSRVEDPSAQVLKQYYQAHLDKFTEPEQFRIGVILIGVDPSSPTQAWEDAKSRAQRLFVELSAGGDFKAIAKAQSTHDSSREGGDLGLLHRGQLSDAAQQAIDRIEPGQVTQPVRVLEGYALFQLEERQAATVLALERVEPRARDLYLRDQATKQWEEFVAALRAQADIVIKPASLEESRHGVGGLE